jgi:hypothetical protein
MAFLLAVSIALLALTWLLPSGSMLAAAFGA